MLLIAIDNLGLDSIAMIKASSRIRPKYNGQQLSINNIFDICKKCRSHSKYLFSVNVITAMIRRFWWRLFGFVTKRTEFPTSVQIRIFKKREHSDLWKTRARITFAQAFWIMVATWHSRYRKSRWIFITMIVNRLPRYIQRIRHEALWRPELVFGYLFILSFQGTYHIIDVRSLNLLLLLLVCLIRNDLL